MFLFSLAELGTDLASKLRALSILKPIPIAEGFPAVFCHSVLFRPRAKICRLLFTWRPVVLKLDHAMEYHGGLSITRISGSHSQSL